jgi:hypothetical protein
MHGCQEMTDNWLSVRDFLRTLENTGCHLHDLELEWTRLMMFLLIILLQESIVVSIPGKQVKIELEEKIDCCVI